MAKKIKENTKFELPATVKEAKLKLLDVKLQITGGKSKDTSKVSVLRKHIAKLLTNKENK